MLTIDDTPEPPVQQGTELPNHASYLLAADLHQQGGNNSSIFDPTTWGERADSGFKFTVSMLTRAVASTYNSGVTVGSWAGIADKSDEVDIHDWLAAVDDDLASYYNKNKESVNTWGDVVGMLIPGTAGIRGLNLAQKGIAAATKGKAGLTLAYNFGVLPTKSAQFAKLAAAEMADTNNVFRAINANVAKSLGSEFAQQYLEMGAFTVAAESTMRQSPLFSDKDAGDILHDALTVGGFVGGGLLTAVSGAKVYLSVKAAGETADAATHAFRTVDIEPTLGTPASERLVIHNHNLQELSGLETTGEFTATQTRAKANTRLDEINNARLAGHDLAKGDIELGNHFTDFALTKSVEATATAMAGATSIIRAGLPEARKVLAELAAPAKEAEKTAKAVQTLEDSLAANTAIGSSEYRIQEAELFAARAKHAEALIAQAQPATKSVDYVQILGADAGTVYSEIPTMRLADKLPDAEAVIKAVAKFKHTQQDKFGIASKYLSGSEGVEDSIEARYITAHTGTFDSSVAVGSQDLPYLERGYAELQAGKAKYITVQEGDMATSMDKSELWQHIKDTKIKLANSIEAQVKLTAELGGGETAGLLNQATLAKILNVSDSWILGDRVSTGVESDYLRMQSDATAFTKSQIEAGLWSEAKGVIKTWTKPSLVQVTRDISKAQKLSGHEVAGVVALKQEQVLYREAADRAFAAGAGEFASQFMDRIPAATLATANRDSTGRQLLTNMNGDYKSLASVVQQIGATVANWKTASVTKVTEAMNPAGFKILADNSADGTEFWKLVQQLRQTPERYVLVKNYEGSHAFAAARNITKAEGELEHYHLVNRNHLEWEAAGSDADKLPNITDTSAPVAIPLTTEGVATWAKEWDRIHRAELQAKLPIRTNQGLSIREDVLTNFYVPGVDAKRFPYYAYVIDPSLTSTGHVSMIHAHTAQDLEALANKVPENFKVIYDKQSADFHLAAKNYDYSLAINENYIDSALKRTGAAAPFQPVTDPKVVWEELMNYRVKQAKGLINELVSHKYEVEFQELRRQGNIYDLANTSTKGWINNTSQKYKTNPYTDYIATALYEDTSGGAPIWDAANRLAETAVSATIGRLSDTWKEAKSPQDLAAVNAHLKSIGVAAFTDAATAMLANHTAPKPALESFVRTMNSILSTLMLRTDPMAAAANGLGHVVLYGTELKPLLKSVGEEGRITIPGTSNTIISPIKLAAQAHKDVVNTLMGVDGGVLKARIAKLNLLPDFAQQFKAITDSATLKGGELSADLYTRSNVAFSAMKSIMDTGEKAGNLGAKVSGNNFVEQWNRLISAATALRVTDAAIADGTLLPELQNSVVNTFVNRVEGVHLAKQRPLLFRGPIGQAVGLFQTYQFNMLQQLFRHVGGGDKLATATLLGLQGGIFGMNGLPAFNAANQYLVGNSSGNIKHSDVITATYGAAGKEAGEWLLYGLSSNLLLHPDAKINLYSRGDINPRQITVIPTTLADIPFVGATSKLFGSMYSAVQQMDKGADKWEAFIKGVQHSGISRPLTGFAQVLDGAVSGSGKVVTTDSANNIIMEHQLFSLMSASRLLGSKPLDEAVALDAYHRVQTYDAASRNQIENLGAGIKATVSAGGIPTQEQIDGFTHEYVKAGGRQEQFAKFYTRQVLNANKSKVNQMIDRSNGIGSQYMQRIMGGYTMEDWSNTGSKATSEGEN